MLTYREYCIEFGKNKTIKNYFEYLAQETIKYYHKETSLSDYDDIDCF